MTPRATTFGGAPGGSGGFLSSLRALSAALAAAGWVAAGAAEPGAAERAAVDELLASAHVHRGDATAVGYLCEALAYRAWIGDAAIVAGLDAVDGAGAHPLLADLADDLRAQHALDMGAWEEAAALLNAAGVLASAQIAGPFPDDGSTGLVTPFAPESAGEGVAWLPVSARVSAGAVYPQERLHADGPAVYYVAAGFDAADPQTVTVLISSTSPYRVWCNGTPRAEQRAPTGLGPFGDEVECAAVRGPNVIVVKLAVNEGSAAVRLRVRGAAVAPGADAHVGALAATPSWPAPRGPDSVIRDALGAAPTGTDAALAAAALAFGAPSLPDRPWMALATRAEADPATPGWLLAAAARSVVPQWRQIELLRAAAIRAPADRFVALRLAVAQTHQLGELDRLDGTRGVRGLAEGPDGLLEARARLAGLAAESGWEAWSTQLWRALAADAPASPAAQDGLVGSLGVGRAEERISALTELWHTRRASVRAYTALADALWDAGRPGEALEILEALTASQPEAPDAWVAAGQSLRAGGDLVASLIRLGRAQSLAPSNPAVLSARAHALLAAGDRDTARAVLERVVALRPQDEDARALARTLASDTTAFYARYRVSLDAIAEQRRQDVRTHPYEVLLDQRVTRVGPTGLATRWVQQAFQVYSRDGAQEVRAHTVSYVPGDDVVEIIEAVVLRADGTVDSAHTVSDRAPPSGPSAMYFDVHAQTVGFRHIDIGDIVVLEYSVAQVGARNMFDTYFGDLWMIQESVPKALARYVIELPRSRRLAVHPAEGWSEEVDGEVRRFELERRDITPIEPESMGPGWTERHDYGAVSTYSDWNTLADWYWELVREQLTPTDEMVAVVRALEAEAVDREDLVTRIHGWVVGNVRYVGLEFGIHGYKPYRTADVFVRRFGDCKDTASLMKQMLGIAGIPSHLVLIRTRDLGRVDGDLPSLAVFNHAIAYVPELDLYLDGTAALSRAAEVPTADQHASALIVLDGAGGRFVTTPGSTAAANTSAADVSVDLTTSPASATGSWTLMGAFAPRARASYETGDTRVRRAGDELSREAPGADVVRVDVDGVSPASTPVRIRWSSLGGEWVTQQGEEWVIRPFGLVPGLVPRYASPPSRTLPLRIDHPLRLTATYRYRIPESWSLQGPTERRTTQTSSFGSVTTSIVLSSGQLTGVMSLEISVAEVSAADYGAFRQFALGADHALQETVRFHVQVGP